MSKFKWLVLVIALFVLLLLAVGVLAQDVPDSTPAPEATIVATPVVEPTPVVIVDTPSEDRLTWRELGLYAVVAVAVIAISVIAYRLATMVGASYPPGTSTALERAREKAQQYTQDSKNIVDDLAFYLADPLVQNAIKAVKEREKTSAPPDGTAAG